MSNEPVRHGPSPKQISVAQVWKGLTEFSRSCCMLWFNAVQFELPDISSPHWSRTGSDQPGNQTVCVCRCNLLSSKSLGGLILRSFLKFSRFLQWSGENIIASFRLFYFHAIPNPLKPSFQCPKMWTGHACPVFLTAKLQILIGSCCQSCPDAAFFGGFLEKGGGKNTVSLLPSHHRWWDRCRDNAEEWKRAHKRPESADFIIYVHVSSFFFFETDWSAIASTNK